MNDGTIAAENILAQVESTSTKNLNQVNTMLRSCIYVMYALYALLIFFTLHNVIRFVIG